MTASRGGGARCRGVLDRVNPQGRGLPRQPRQPESQAWAERDRGGAVARRAARASGWRRRGLATQIAAEMRPVDHRLGVSLLTLGRLSLRRDPAAAAQRVRPGLRALPPPASARTTCAPRRPGCTSRRSRSAPASTRPRSRSPTGTCRRRAPGRTRSCSPGSCRSRPRRWPASATPEAAQATRLDSLRWARYGFGDTDGALAREQAQLAALLRLEKRVRPPMLLRRRLRARRAPRLAARRPARRRPARPAAVRRRARHRSSSLVALVARRSSPRRAGARLAMYAGFFAELRAAKVPVSLREYLGFLEALDAGLVLYDAEGFYYLARASAGEGRAPHRPLRPGVRRRLQRARGADGRGDRRAARPAGGLAAEARREAPDARRRRPRSRRSAASRS